MPAFPAGGRRLTSPCAVENLAAAVERALASDYPSGEAFNVSDGADLPWRDFLGLAAGELGVKPPRFPLPVTPLRVAAALLEKVYILRHSSNPPPITPYRIAQAAKDYSFSVEKAKRLLGYEPSVSTAEAIRESVEWFREEEGP
jgi:2-alkyl-3-oxoalkanoate reductase